MFHFSRSAVRVAWSTHLVNISAGPSVPSTFSGEICLDRSFSWIYKSVQSRWRFLPMPLLWAMPMAAVAFYRTSMVTQKPMSLASACSPRACAMPGAMPWSSASPDERLTVVCVLLQCSTQQPPHIASHPLVDRRELEQPARSVSMYTVSPGGVFCQPYM